MKNIRIMDHIEKYAVRTPDAPAIMDTQGRCITYKQLNQTVDLMTQFLNSRGIKIDQRIAVVIPNGLEMAVAYFAVSNIATFVPLSHEFSEEQYRFYFDLLNTDTLIISQDLEGPLEKLTAELNINILFIKKNDTEKEIKYEFTGGTEIHSQPVILAKNEDIAIVNYTSGTTAKPKIVPKSHINDYSYPLPAMEYLSLNSQDRLLIMTPMSRHISLDMMLTALACGSCAICADVFEPAIFFRLINDLSPTWFIASPVVYQAIVDYAENRKPKFNSELRFVLSAGAPLVNILADRIGKVLRIPVFNAYGSTETGWLACTSSQPKGLRNGSTGVPIGIDLGIMDENGILVGCNMIGEIVARGPAVIKGYDDDEIVNKNSFYNEWFRTGDSGYLDEDGYLYITGRIKELINRGGEKISPYEVEEMIAGHPDVLQAVVFPFPGPDGNEEVGAAVVLKEGAELYLKDLRRFLKDKVTAFKMPVRLYVLLEIPASSAGKIQRNMFFSYIDSVGISPQPEFDKNKTRFLPRNKTEKNLYKIFKEILPVKEFDIDDTFFELGGDSLKAALLYERIKKHFKLQIPLKHIFSNGSVRSIAEYIDTNQLSISVYPFLVPFQEQGTKTPIFLVHAEEGEAVVFRHLAQNFDAERPLYSFTFNPEEGNWKHPVTFEQIASHYIKDIRAVQPKGPYLLGGHCVGGMLAYEMARQLSSNNEKVRLVAMYDPLLPDAKEEEDLNIKLIRNINEFKEQKVYEFIGKKIYFYRNRLLNFLYQKSPVYFLKIIAFRLMDNKSLISYGRSYYKLNPYKGNVIYFKPENNSGNTSDISIGIWSKQVENLQVISLKGTHNSVFQEENAENTRRVLEKVLHG